LSPTDPGAIQFKLGDLGVTKLFSELDAANALAEWIRPPEAIVSWFSVKMRVRVSPKGRRFRPSGGDFQGMRIYRSDVVVWGFVGGANFSPPKIDHRPR